MNAKKVLPAMMAAVVLMAPACGGETDGVGGGHDHAAGEEDDSHDSGGSGDFAFGKPADPAEADRTIKVEGSDKLRFDPDQLEIKAGETVAFEFVNTGDLAHEFVLGDEAALGEHAHGGDQPNGTGEVPGGGSETLAWTFSDAGELAYECHVDDHHKAGMRGTITVK